MRHLFFENNRRIKYPAIQMLKEWAKKDESWLVMLGDYGVGKSWLLKKYLYDNIASYKSNPLTAPLAFFVPLQSFTKAFDFQNLILKSFEVYGIAGATYSAFEYLLNNRRIILLLDSFDEMAQHLSKDVIRNNLNELLGVTTQRAKVIMTSRPNYFENRSERLLTLDSGSYGSRPHILDALALQKASELAEELDSKLRAVRFARLNDLTDAQRKQLFKIVLGANSVAYAKLSGLFQRHQELTTISQRAVIARLLTRAFSRLAESEGDSRRG